MNWLPMISVAAQVTLVATVALVAASRLRSAAHRHSVFLAALICMLASPFFFVGTVWTGLNLPVFRVPGSSEISLVQSAVLHPGQSVDRAPLELSAPSPQDSTALGPVEGREDQTAEAVITRPLVVKSSTFRAGDIIAWVWMLGTLFLGLGLIRSSWKTWKVLKTVRPLEREHDIGIVAEAARRLGAAELLRVGTTGKVGGPVVIGLLRPWILIPLRYLETLSQEELLQVLIHEGAHALRRDPLVALGQQICRALFWWHPVVHRLNQQLIRAREEVCDNFVLAHVDAVDYGTTLLKLATLSPATARLSMAIGIFDSRDSLEDRIRDLLDSRRPRMTRVRFLTAAVLGVFTILSVFTAASRVIAQNPSSSANGAAPISKGDVVVAKVVAADPKQLRLILSYHGESDKPFYGLTLSVPPVSRQLNSFALFEQIEEEQAVKIIRYLEQSEFFKHAKVTATQDDPKTGPQYLLRVSTGEAHYEETLGWDIGTILRLDALRKTFDGSAAQGMDQLLRRLDGERKIWESGRIVNDLKATLSQEKQAGRYGIGEAIPIKLEFANISKENRSYDHHQFIRSGSEIVVEDENGRKVPSLVGGASLIQRQVVIAGGESKIIEDCDLSDYFYLRRPGRYVVSFHSPGLPSSNALQFEVAASAGSSMDGDPMERLMQLNSAKWTIVGNPNALKKMQPGQNRTESSGWQFLFVDREKGMKGSRFAVWLWLTREPALQVTNRDKLDLPSEFLGNISQWYVYIYVSPEALAAWPTVKEDIAKVLDRTPVNSHNRGNPHEDDPVRRLRPLVRDGWSLGTSSDHTLKVQPGSNWGETTCRIIRFVHKPPVHDGHGLINLWLADQAAVAKPVNAISSQPTSEYLGKLDKWHVYYLASEQALATWPTAKADIKSALSQSSATTASSDGTTVPADVSKSDNGKTSGEANDEEYRLLHDRYKKQILTALRDGRNDELVKLTDELNTSIGGKLLYVQIVSRRGPIAEHATLLSKFYGDRKISIGKVNYAVATKVQVTPNANGEGYVLIATNSLAKQQWPDDLQITLAMDAVPSGISERASKGAK